MIILIILLVLTIGGIFLTIHFDEEAYFGLTVTTGILTFCVGIYLVVHIFAWSLSSYYYNLFELKRQAFVETLDEARKNSNPIELAAITKDVSEWNQKLIERQYDRKTFLFRNYQDERILTLKPIK